MGFKELFYPRAVAVFGSVSPGKLGGILLGQIQQYGFEHVYAINSKGKNFNGIPGYTDLSQIDQEIDLAVIATPASTVAGILEQCGSKGIKAAVIISSGFAEAGNGEGEEKILRIAKKHNINFIGPNCAGLINTHSKLAPTLQAFPPSGATAVVSQSGAVGGAIMEWAQLHGLGISKFVSYGNGADLNQIEFLRYLKDDQETRVIALYIENVENGRAFMELLKEVTKVKPVVIIKSGRTNTGQRAALSHTGSMAGSDAVYDAALRESGAIRVKSLDEMIDLCKGFAYLPPVKGRKIAIVTNSGGPGVMTADLGEELDLNIAEPTPGLQELLKSFLPSWAGFYNPIDMTVEGTGDNYRRVIEECSAEYDAVLPIFFGPPYLPTGPIAEGILAGFKNCGKPVVSAMETGLNVADSVQYLRTNGLPNFVSTERAITVIARMAAYEEMRSGNLNRPNVKPEPLRGRLFSSDAALLEPEAMKILKDHNIAATEYQFVDNRQDVVNACRSFGYPVVMKVVSPEILHKSDSGGVKLNLNDDAAALTAYDQIARMAEKRDFRGVIICPMIEGGQEVIIGVTRDAQFGPVVIFGLGGIYTEVLQDFVMRVAPIDEDEALKMISEIRSYAILQGSRGGNSADLDALAVTIARFSQLPFIYPDLEEADLNPVFALPQGIVIADVRLIAKQQAL